MLVDLIEQAHQALVRLNDGGDLGTAYLGMQGDQWDAQKDMALAAGGALLAGILFGYLGHQITSKGGLVQQGRDKGKVMFEEVQKVSEMRKGISLKMADLSKLIQTDPAKGAAELNRTMHFLSATELEHIEHLQRMGEVTAAQAELAGKLKDRLGEITPQLGTLERAWDAVKGASSRAWDAMMGIGRENTTKQKLDAVLQQIKDALHRL